MKFPKERVLIKADLEKLLKEQDFYSVYKMKDRMLDNYQILDASMFEILVSCTFYIGNFDQVIIFYSELKRLEIESFDIIYYTLLSLIANCDIFQAMSIIKKSIMLNTDDILSFHTSDGANYSSLLSISEESADVTRCLLIVNFVKGLSIEMSHQKEQESEYILYRYFDLINLIYELGYPIEIIQELSLAMKIIFNLSI